MWLFFPFMSLQQIKHGCKVWSKMTYSVHHRYSRLHQFHQQVSYLLPRGFPPFPPKHFGNRSNYDPSYLRARCVSLSSYFSAILHLPGVSTGLLLNVDSIDARVPSTLCPWGRSKWYHAGSHWTCNKFRLSTRRWKRNEDISRRIGRRANCWHSASATIGIVRVADLCTCGWDNASRATTRITEACTRDTGKVIIGSRTDR